MASGPITSWPQRKLATEKLEKVTCAVLCLVNQLGPTLCDPMDYRPPGFFVHGDSPGKNTGVGYHFLLQGIFLTQGLNLHLPREDFLLLSYQQSYVYSSCVLLCCLVASDSLWTHGLQPTRLLCPWGFSRQESWSGLPCLPPGDLPYPGIEPMSPALQANSLPLSHQKNPI